LSTSSRNTTRSAAMYLLSKILMLLVLLVVGVKSSFDFVLRSEKRQARLSASPSSQHLLQLSLRSFMRHNSSNRQKFSHIWVRYRIFISPRLTHRVHLRKSGCSNRNDFKPLVLKYAKTRSASGLRQDDSTTRNAR